MTMNNGDRTFVKVTNNDIIKEITKINEKLDTFGKDNAIAHAKLFSNGKRNLMIATFAVAAIVTLLGFFVTHLAK